MKSICGLPQNEFCKSAVLLLSKEFQNIVNVATQNAKCFIQIDLLLQTGPDSFQLFYLSKQDYAQQSASIESMLLEGAVIQTPITIQKPTDSISPTKVGRTEMQQCIVLHKYFCSSVQEIKYKGNRAQQKDAPAIYAILMIKKEEWPSDLAVTFLFDHFIANINQSKNAFTSESLHAINLQQARMSINSASEIIQRSCESYLNKLFNNKEIISSDETPYFCLVCNLACMPYEGRTNTGLIRFSTSSSKNSNIITFQNQVLCLEENKREIRKLLEMTDDETALLVNNHIVVGMVKDKLYKSYIKFYGNGKWRLYKDNSYIPVISVEGNSCKYHVICHENELLQAYQKVFQDSGSYSAIKLIVDSAIKQKHGTAIIVCINAQEEAIRLSSFTRAISITPRALVDSDSSIIDEKLIRSLTSIDGALIISPEGTCYAIGAILDGVADCKGSTARGARYNSILTYVQWKKSGVLAIVISEDQSVDYIFGKTNV